MNTSFRVLAAVGILVLAMSGCGKGKDSASASGMHKGDVSKSGQKEMRSAKAEKTGKSAKNKAESEARSAEKKHEKSKATTTSTSHTTYHSGTLTAEDNGKEIDLRQGQVITVVLESNKASGLSWALVEPTGSVVVMQGSPAYAVKSAKRGGGGTETWHFRAAKPGHQTVKMEYRRKWASSVPERTFRLDVNVH